jgi:hypothetical protein
MTGLLPNHRERQFMQYLRGSGWVKVSTLPEWPRVIANLLAQGWIECRIDFSGLSYRLTEKGLAAKVTPMPVGLKARK